MTAPDFPDISLSDLSFKIEDTPSCHLNVQVSGGTLSFAVLNTASNQYQVLKSFIFQRELGTDELIPRLDQLIQSEPLLSGSYRSVTVLIDTRFSTLVPLALFNADKKDLYLTFNLNMDLTGMTVRSDQISLIEAVNLYPVAGPLEGLLRKAFRNPVMLHFTTSLLQNVLLQLPFPTHPVTACLYVRHGRFDLLIRKEHRLVYCNSFIYKAIEDVVYYLMFVSEQLHLAAEGIHLTFMGEMGRYSMLVELLGKYIREIEFMPRNDQFRYGNVFDELPGHYFFNLLNAGLCEL